LTLPGFFDPRGLQDLSRQNLNRRPGARQRLSAPDDFRAFEAVP
jgi:hypothetical protein